jgi:cytochrome c oxidase cbb3-type subunit 1
MSRSQAQAQYNPDVVRAFSVMTVIWGIVGMRVGVLIAAERTWPDLVPAIPWLSYGRLHPLHTNAVIFALGGWALFATSYYVVRRTCQTRLFGSGLARFTFWGWQLIILAAAVTLPLGYASGKEYAELEWPIDIAITVVWVSYAIVFFGTLAVRGAVPVIDEDYYEHGLHVNAELARDQQAARLHLESDL